MAKRLINHYEIDLANNAVLIENNILSEALLIITDVDTNTILYNFANPGQGYQSRSFSEATEYTTFVLTTDMTAAGVTPTSRLQIFVEEASPRIDVAESLLDPVNKIRVSNPENLIDTDFEYGLQSTKWETLELSNNVPSYYVSDSDLPLDIVDSITSVTGSDIITVRCSEPHGLVVGTPIDVRGLTSRTAEGKFLISSAGDEVFTYKAVSVQTSTGIISSIYTTITPGQFYSGSQIPIDVEAGITTNERNPATLRVETPYPHGYVVGSNFYLVNSVGTKQVQITETTGSTAPDGRPYVDPDNFLTVQFQNDNSGTETKQLKATYSLKFNAGSVDVNNNSIVWQGNLLRNNDCVLYVPPSGDTEIGGLQRFQVYYVRNRTDTGFQLSSTYNGAAINLTSTGTYNYGRATLNMCYEVARMYNPPNNYYTYYYLSAWRYGTGNNSGWDTYDNTYRNTNRGNMGIGQKVPYARILFSPNSSTASGDLVDYYFSRGYNSNMIMPETDTIPSDYNFIEDWQRYSNPGYYALRGDYIYGYTSGAFYGIFDNGFNYSGSADTYVNRGQFFYMLLEEDSEGDTFFKENHNLADGSAIELVDPNPPVGGPTPSTDVLGDLISLASTLNGTNAQPGSYGNIANTINNAVDDFNVFVIATDSQNAESLPGIASPSGVHPGNTTGFVYNTSNGNFLSTGGELTDFSGGASRGYAAADGNKWMAAAMYANNVFQGLMVWVFTGDDIDQSNNITPNVYNITRTADFFFPDVGNYDYHRIYSFVINPGGTIASTDFTEYQGWRYSNNQQPLQTGYQSTSRFASDDGFWAFAQGGRKVDGNSPGPDYKTTQGYGFGNYNAGDTNASFYWNGSNLSSTNFVGYIFSGDGLGGSVNPSGLIVRTSTSNSINDNTPNIELPYGDYSVRVIDNNRFQLANSLGTQYRLVSATGEYEFIGQEINPTANSFYSAGHGYNGNEEVEIGVLDGGTLPSTESGSIIPRANFATGTTDEAFTLMDQYLKDYNTNNADIRDIVMSPFQNSTQHISSGVASGSSSWLSYISQNGGYIYDQNRRTGTSLLNDARLTGYWNESEVKNQAQSPYDNDGYGVIGTQWVQNGAVPHYTWMTYGNNGNVPHEFRNYTYTQANTNIGVTNRNSNQNVTFTSTAGDSNWRYTAQANYENGDASRQGYVHYMIRIWNNGWFGTQFHYQYNYGGTRNNQFMYQYGTAPGYFSFYGVLGLETSTSWTDTTVEQFFDNFALYFADNFSYPSLTLGGKNLIEVVNTDRFRLKNLAGFSVDLTDNGSSTITFTERGVIGALDGAYTVSAVPTEDTFDIDLPFSAPSTDITFDASLITTDYINLAEPHNFSPGSPVTYFNNGNADVGGIVSETEYYVAVIDDVTIGLANTYIDAINANINALTAAGASEIHRLNFTTVNGRLRGAGSVTTTENSKLVIGNEDTLFKRYYKVGDIIGIKNNNTNPGTINDYIISAIADDQTLEVTDVIPYTATNTAYFLETALYARPDGYAVHRPFDGGVEIAAGTAPFSQIRRQTRKYFRYQSGKGIQTSLAINFNPPVQFETLSATLDTTKTDKCIRDIEYFLDGVTYDLTLGTNYNSIFLGIAETNSLDINETVLNSIRDAKTRTLQVPQVADSTTATTRVTNFFDEVLNISENGRQVASSYSFTNPSNATASRIAAKDKILANIDFITAEINAYVDVNYAPTDHDVGKCTRDIKYALYSFAYDILYGGNSATYDNAKFFYYFDTANNPGIDPSHKQQTVDAYDHLGAILVDIVQGIAITPSTGNTETQVTSGNNASSGDAAIIDDLANIIRRVVRYGAATLEGTGNAETLFVTNNGSSDYIINGEFNDQPLTVVRGVTYTIDVSAVGHPFWIKTAATTGTGNQYNTGVTNNGTDNGIITWTVDATAPNTLYYQCEIHSAMGAAITVIDKPTKTYPSVTWSATELQDAKNDIDANATQIAALAVPDIYSATGVTRYPHRLSLGQSIQVSGSADPAFNGDFFVNETPDEFTLKFTLDTLPQSSIPNGIIQFNLNGYGGAYTRAGMFDFQNGFFFEYNGQELYCVRRSSTQQLSGTVRVSYNSNLVTGTNTNFLGQISEQDKIVIRGGTYKVVKINSRNELIIQPQYKGITASNVILTKTVDVKVPQSEWNVDTCDGFGPSGFNLNINKIQMAYMDYSWYGAGKVRFGFKDRKGHVRYVHEFLHNNRLDEAYMRSGNIPAAYEIENDENPSYAPTLFHWGTSVIMDGTFDEDDAYLFTATSNTLTFTNGQANTATTNANSQLIYEYNRGARSFDWWVELSFPSSDASKFSSGTPLYTTGGELNGEQVDYTEFEGSSIKVYIYIQRSRNFPSVYPIVPQNTVVSIGAPSAGGSGNEVSLGTAVIPLVTLRLAPSVDSSLSGELGAREIINRMQLKLNEVGLILTHDCEVSLILNGDLSSINWQNVNSPSLSQLIRHEAGERIVGGTEVFSFRASGGSVDNTGKRLANTSNFPLTSLIDMGNSILGGNGVFPNGPDILTVAVRLVNTSDVSANSPFVASARITWSESQA